MTSERPLKQRFASTSELSPISGPKLIRTLGVESVDIIMKRAIVEVVGSYPAIASVRYSDERVWYEDVEGALGGETRDEIVAAFQALNSVMLLVVARMLGREIAMRLAEGVGGNDLIGGPRA